MAFILLIIGTANLFLLIFIYSFPLLINDLFVVKYLNYYYLFSYNIAIYHHYKIKNCNDTIMFAKALDYIFTMGFAFSYLIAFLVAFHVYIMYHNSQVDVLSLVSAVVALILIIIENHLLNKYLPYVKPSSTPAKP